MGWRPSLKPLWWALFTGACLVPLALRLAVPMHGDGEWVVALLVATAALALALRSPRFGSFRALPFAIVGALAGVVLPLVLAGKMLAPDPGYYVSREAPPGQEVLVVDGSWTLAFGTGPVSSFVVLTSDLDGTVGGTWRDAPVVSLTGPWEGTYDIFYFGPAPRNVIVGKPWPASSELVLHDRGRVTRYRRASRAEALAFTATGP